jgi:hypothetical protein
MKEKFFKRKNNKKITKAARKIRKRALTMRMNKR